MTELLDRRAPASEPIRDPLPAYPRRSQVPARDPGRREGALLAMLAAATAWFAACSWAPLYAAPREFLLPGLVLALVVAGIGALGRDRGLRPWAVLPIQLLVSYVLLALWANPAGGRRGPGGLGSLGTALAHGLRQINAYASPAPQRFVDVRIFLLACVVLLAIAIDLIACGMRRAPLSGLGVLLAVTVPISVLAQRLEWWVFLSAGAGYLCLLAVAHRREQRSWGRQVASPAGGRAPLVGAGVPIAAASLLLALAASYVVPVPGGLFHGSADSGAGGGDRSVTLTNPMIDLRRDLIQMSHTPVLTARTNDPDPSYVPLTVLDDFTGNQWRASDRKLPSTNRLPGEIPPAPGIGLGQPGRNTVWNLALADTFHTSWLPVPSPATRIDIGGDWRYDARTLDVVDVGTTPTSNGVHYKVHAFHPQYNADVLNDAGYPQGDPVAGMTDLPPDVPAVIPQTARKVTAGAKTQYEKLVALQEWFRSTGGFRYSTEPAPGSGMALLADFITKDKVGYCEQFAAAMAVMGRSLGIPSRVVVGFLRPTGKAPRSDEVEYTTDDLHSWPEFYFAGSGWVTFDPTPGARTGVAPAYTSQRLHPTGGPTTVTTAPQPTAKPSSHKPQVLPTGPGARGGHRPSGGLSWWWLAIPALIAIAGAPRVLRSRQRRRRLSAPDARGLATGCWAELRATARDLGIGWVDGRSPRQAFATLRSRVTADVALVGDLDWLCGYVERAWYAPALATTSSDLERARGVVTTWIATMREIAPERAVRRATWLAPTLFERD